MMKTSLVLGALACAALTSPDARADGADKAACLAAASQGQVQRDAHKLIEAREQFRFCARPQCPKVVQSDCTTWVTDLDRTVPTVVLSAKDAAGEDITDVSVTADGQTLATSLSGDALPVNPGPHTFKFERADGSVATQQVLIKEGDKLRSVAVVLARQAPAAAVHDVAGTPTAEEPGKTARILGIVAGGAGVVTAGIGIGVAFAAKSKDNQSQGEPGIARQSDSSSAVTEGNVATGLLVAGAVMVAGGVVLWLTAPRAKAAVGMNGRELLVRWTF